MQDIHHISEYGENHMVKQKYEYEGPPYSNPSRLRNEQLRNSKTNTTQMDSYKNPHEYHTFTNHYREDLYNSRLYGNFEPFLIEKEENKLTIQDRIRINWGLQILRNFLPRIYPNYVVIQQIGWLNYLCYTKKSIQPLRDFYEKYNLMGLWPSY